MQSPKCIFFLATSLFCLWLGQKYERSKLRQLLPSWMRWLEMRMSCEEDSMRGWCDLLTLLPHCADQEIMQLVKGALATSTSVGGVAARGMGPAPYVTSVSWALASDYHLAIAATPPPRELSRSSIKLGAVHTYMYICFFLRCFHKHKSKPDELLFFFFACLLFSDFMLPKVLGRKTPKSIISSDPASESDF